MNFAARPENDFPEFIDTYFSRCRALCPEIEGNAGKWKAEDLIPGLSDFDTRFLTRDGLAAKDWHRISMKVAEVHLALARERPAWARTLEHLPGVNLTWSELFDPAGYYPEFCQWTFYRGPESRLEQARAAFARRPWSEADLIYHWKRIALYYERYNRSIDPPINLGKFESKYPMHSRFLHYLAPPLHSAVCLFDRANTPGKLDAFRRAREIFPQPEIVDLVLEEMERHYEISEWYDEPRLTELDILLEDYLRGVITTLLGKGAGINCPSKPTPEQLRAAVKTLPQPDPLVGLFENIKFARFMGGRLWFFAHEVPWFDSLPLIRIELGRIRKNFLVTPLEIFSQQFFNCKMDWIRTLEALMREGISKRQIQICHRFHDLADPKTSVMEYRSRAWEIVEFYGEFLEVLERVAALSQRIKLPV